MIDLSRRGGARGVRGEIYRIAGIIFQKESRRGQTLSWWRHRVVVKGPREEWDVGRGAGGLAAREAGRQAGWLAGSVVALVLIHNPCRSPSRRRRKSRKRERDTHTHTHTQREREREERGRDSEDGGGQ